MTGKNIKYYIALQGNYPPPRYIELANYIEKLGFDRIYIYDDLLYYPSIPILTLIAEHTKKIEIGPCLLNGFYRHPAIIASSILAINELAKGRTVLGLGRGAFYDYLGMDNSESSTRKGFEETVKFVRHLLHEHKGAFKGHYFNANKNTYLKINSSEIPLITGTWNENMAYIAGKYCNEIQIADVWDVEYLNSLQNNFLIGNSKTNLIDNPTFSIGGICCVSEDEQKCLQKVIETLLVYLPYLTKILKRCNIKYSEGDIIRMSDLTAEGKIKEASQYVTREMIDTLTIWGTPKQVADRINTTLKLVKADSIMFSVPFGVEDSVEENLKLIKEKVLPLID